MKKSVLAVSSCILLVAQALAEPVVQSKIDICHFDEIAGAWVLISIAEEAASAHLQRHDDAFPGGNSVVSGAPLDVTCQLTDPTHNRP